MERLPLQDMRVVDLGWVWAGAVLGHILSDFGAQVVKIESRRRLDPARQGRPIIGDKPDPEQNPLFHNVNRGKMSTTIDFTHPAGQDLIKRLVATSDIVIENMTPHALTSVGLDYPHLREVNPSIIMISHPLAGHYGPFSELRGYGPTAASLAGLDSVTGYLDEERPCGYSHAIGDPNVGLHGALAVLAAVRHRTSTGEGQYIDMSMWEALTGLMGFAIMDYTLNGRVATPTGNRHPAMAPHGIYPCTKDGELDKWISIAIKTDEEWRALCRAMGNPPWADDAGFADLYGRQRRHDELDRSLGEWTRQYSQYELLEMLQKAGVAAMPCLDQEGRFFDPHLQERECYVSVDHPVQGTEPLYGIPFKLSETPGRIGGRAPLMGEHNDYVMHEIVGLSQQEVDELVHAKVLY